MPKIKTTRLQKVNNMMRGVLLDCISQKGLLQNQFGNEIGVSSRVGLLRLENPTNLKLGELHKIESWLSDEQILRLARGRKPDRTAVNVYIDKGAILKLIGGAN